MKLSPKLAGCAVIATIVISLVMGYGVTRLNTEVEFEKFLPEEFPSVKTLAEFEQRFPTTAQVMLLIESDNLVKAGPIKKVLLLENLILEDPKIKGSLVQEVSFTTYTVRPILENTGGALPPDPQLELAVQQALSQPEVAESVVGRYLSADHKAALMLISVLGTLPQENKNAIVDRIEGYADNVSDENFTIGITGDVVLYLSLIHI